MIPAPLSPEVDAALDPGIRGAVAFLRGAGFNTTDSGDGVSKALDVERKPGSWLDFPHVSMTVDPDRMRAEADRLRDVLHSIGIELVPPEGEDAELYGPYIDVSYAPTDGVAVLTLINVDDGDLRRFTSIF